MPCPRKIQERELDSVSVKRELEGVQKVTSIVCENSVSLVQKAKLQCKKAVCIDSVNERKLYENCMLVNCPQRKVGKVVEKLISAVQIRYTRSLPCKS